MFTFSGKTLAVVCDGMGGHAGGAQASTMAIRIIFDKLRGAARRPVREALVEAVTEANRQIYETSRRSHRLMGMGTTVVAAIAEGDTVHIAHVGDSRAYLVREEQAVQLTRDHTMVNLFVEAELLSPEDAASHPEAHVLARSLGVERTVEVDLHEPVTLQEGDCIVLCSDGVHGLLTDWEFGRVDWGSPQQGVRKVLQMVTDREGDDNATVVALGFGEAVRSELGATPPPSMEQLSDFASGGSPGAQAAPQQPPAPAAPVPSLVTPQLPEPIAFEEPPPTPSVVGQQLEAASGLVSYQEPDIPLRSAVLDGGPEEPPPPTTDKPSTVRLLLVGGAAAAAVLVMAIPMLLLIGPNRGDETPAEAPTQDGNTTSQIVVEGPEDGASQPGVSGAVASGITVEDVPPEQWSFAPTLPPELEGTPPHRAKRFTRKSPGGRYEFEAVTAARNHHECARSMQIMHQAIQQSVDYASIYGGATWICFDTDHFKPLAEAQADDLTQFSMLLRHFEGDLEDAPEDQLALPYWYRDATDGLEYRLQAWSRSNDVDLFATVMLDLRGGVHIADQLGRDLLLEVQAAEALAAVQTHTEESVQWWARRVFQTCTALDGPVGDLVKKHRPDMYGEIEFRLDRAVPPLPEVPEDATEEQVAELDPVPADVRSALAVCKGEEEPPDAEPGRPVYRPRTRPQATPEPTAPKVYRIKEGAPPVEP